MISKLASLSLIILFLFSTGYSQPNTYGKVTTAASDSNQVWFIYGDGGTTSLKRMDANLFISTFISGSDTVNVDTLKLGSQYLTSENDSLIFYSKDVRYNLGMFVLDSVLDGEINSNASVVTSLAHVTSDGSSHSDVATNTSTLSTGFSSGVQDVGNGAAPVLDATNFTNMPEMSPLTTKGDLYTYSTGNARLAKGTDGYVLKSNSSTSTGLEWGLTPTNVTGGRLPDMVTTDTTATGESKVIDGGIGSIQLADSFDVGGFTVNADFSPIVIDDFANSSLTGFDTTSISVSFSDSILTFTPTVNYGKLYFGTENLGGFRLQFDYKQTSGSFKLRLCPSNDGVPGLIDGYYFTTSSTISLYNSATGTVQTSMSDGMDSGQFYKFDILHFGKKTLLRIYSYSADAWLLDWWSNYVDTDHIDRFGKTVITLDTPSYTGNIRNVTLEEFSIMGEKAFYKEAKYQNAEFDKAEIDTMAISQANLNEVVRIDSTMRGFINLLTPPGSNFELSGTVDTTTISTNHLRVESTGGGGYFRTIKDDYNRIAFSFRQKIFDDVFRFPFCNDNSSYGFYATNNDTLKWTRTDPDLTHYLGDDFITDSTFYRITCAKFDYYIYFNIYNETTGQQASMNIHDTGTAFGSRINWFTLNEAIEVSDFKLYEIPLFARQMFVDQFITDSLFADFVMSNNIMSNDITVRNTLTAYKQPKNEYASSYMESDTLKSFYLDTELFKLHESYVFPPHADGLFICRNDSIFVSLGGVWNVVSTASYTVKEPK